MRPPRHLAARRVNDGSVEQAAWGSEQLASRRSLNLEACAAIRRTMDEQTGQPDVALLDGGMGPPSAIIPAPYVEHDATKQDQQARDTTGKYSKHKKYTP